jgi:hypothetical protein
MSRIVRSLKKYPDVFEKDVKALVVVVVDSHLLRLNVPHLFVIHGVPVFIPHQLPAPWV